MYPSNDHNWSVIIVVLLKNFATIKTLKISVWLFIYIILVLKVYKYNQQKAAIDFFPLKTAPIDQLMKPQS